MDDDTGGDEGGAGEKKRNGHLFSFLVCLLFSSRAPSTQGKRLPRHGKNASLTQLHWVLHSKGGAAPVDIPVSGVGGDTDSDDDDDDEKEDDDEEAAAMEYSQRGGGLSSGLRNVDAIGQLATALRSLPKLVSE